MHARQRRSVDPLVEESIELAVRLGLERRLDVLGAGLLESPRRVETPHSLEKDFVAEQPPQHVQRQRALVVDERAKYAAVVPNVAEAVAEIHRALIGSVERPARHLGDDGVEHRFLLDVFGVERRKVLREPFANPLLVIVLPSDGLAPPLVRRFMREKEFGEAVEVRGIARATRSASPAAAD